MDFNTAWSLAVIGAQLSVSNGDPQPSEDDDAPRRGAWKRRNFVGTVIEKPPGQIVVQLPESAEGRAVYIMEEAHGCTFEFPAPPVTFAEAIALERVEADAEKNTGDTVRRLRRQIAVDRLWQEIQLHKIAVFVNAVPTTILGRRKMFPTLSVIAALKSETIETVAPIMEARLWERVKRMTVIEARLYQAHDSVREATTAEGKIAAAENASWTNV